MYERGMSREAEGCILGIFAQHCLSQRMFLWDSTPWRAAHPRCTVSPCFGTFEDIESSIRTVGRRSVCAVRRLPALDEWKYFFKFALCFAQCVHIFLRAGAASIGVGRVPLTAIGAAVDVMIVTAAGSAAEGAAAVATAAVLPGSEIRYRVHHGSITVCSQSRFSPVS